MPEKTKESPAKQASSGPGKYSRFGLMIVTAMVAMYAMTYLNSYEWGHVRFSETRLYMTLIMGAGMALIMLGFMLDMYRSRKRNVAIVAASLVVFGLAVWLVRSQVIVEDQSYMRAMIPHHSIAILTSRNAQIDDLRVRDLADRIIDAQVREIKEMNWLIEDIERNGVAASEAETAARPVPDFSGEE